MAPLFVECALHPQNFLKKNIKKKILKKKYLKKKY